ncbi:MAG: VOC family protein, partial [Pseudomonadota bacterium]
LIEWLEPEAEGSPTKALNEVGFARLCFYTKDIWADYASLKEDDVELFSEPVNLDFANGSSALAFCFRDPDGTVLELVGFEQ